MPYESELAHNLPRYMTQAEVAAFFRAVSLLRDQALFALMYLYGLRVSEVTLLERADVDFDRHRLVVKRVKGGIWGERPLFAGMEPILQSHLAAATRPDATALFPGRAGALRKRQIQALFGRYSALAGLPRRYSCHSLRHSIATHLLDAGASLEFVQDHLGHRSIRSTTIYARITDQHRAAVYERLEESPWIVRPGGEVTEAHRSQAERLAP